MPNQGASPVAEFSGRSASANDSLAPTHTVTSLSDEPGDDDDDVVEQDPSGRFSRYASQVGSGRFKQVYRGFDEKRGLDIAWSKITAATTGLTQDQMMRAVEEISNGVGLDHPNVIRCYQCWLDEEAACINLITEFFTSGNLRDYRQRHKNLDVKAVKKWSRQVLLGLSYLHNNTSVICHGDLRADKLYINGHSGEIKIGDLGLAVLVPKRFAPDVMPEGDPKDQYTPPIDIFAFGLVVLELVTGRKMDRDHQARGLWQAALDEVADPLALAFVERCLASVEDRPSALELLEDPFLQTPRKSASGAPGEGEGLRRNRSEAGATQGAGQAEDAPSRAPLSWSDEERRAECEAGFVRGEDYLFQFSGKIRGGKLHFRLHMQYEGEGGPEVDTSSKTIDFVYDPDADTPDEIAAEISNEFNLSSTDRDICAAALKEWLAKEMDDRD
ncbi:hypothetical protein ACKKBF_B30670 [Auxenochlorella protothecoides x Auxenochlorella symbiontica]